MSVSSRSGLWWGRILPGSSWSLRQACLRGRMPFSSIMTRVQLLNRGFSNAPSYWLLHFKRQVTLLTRRVTKSSLSTPENMPDNVARSIMGAHGEGNKQHADFVAHRLMRASSHSVTMPIKKVIPYTERQLANTKRVDVIWDRYLPTTRQRRRTGIRQRMGLDGNWTFPRNWSRYLQNVSNKVELFHQYPLLRPSSVKERL